MENGLSNSSKRSLKISLRSPKRNLKKNLVTTVTLCYVNSSVTMNNAPLLAYYQSYSFNLTSIVNHRWRKSFTSVKWSCVCGDFSKITVPVTFSPYPLTLNESKYIGLVPLQCKYKKAFCLYTGSNSKSALCLYLSQQNKKRKPVGLVPLQ